MKKQIKILFCHGLTITNILWEFLKLFLIMIIFASCAIVCLAHSQRRSSYSCIVASFHIIKMIFFFVKCWYDIIWHLNSNPPLFSFNMCSFLSVIHLYVKLHHHQQISLPIGFSRFRQIHYPSSLSSLISCYLLIGLLRFHSYSFKGIHRFILILISFFHILFLSLPLFPLSTLKFSHPTFIDVPRNSPIFIAIPINLKNKNQNSRTPSNTT